MLIEVSSTWSILLLEVALQGMEGKTFTEAGLESTGGSIVKARGQDQMSGF